MLFNGLESNIQGGIGSQLIRTMACAGEAIKEGIKANHIILKVVEYTNNKDLHYHNSERLKDYINTSINIIRTGKQLEKTYNFDSHMYNLIVHFYGSKLKNKYLDVDSHIHKEVDNSDIYWIRGKDRPSNINVFKQIMKAREK